MEPTSSWPSHPSSSSSLDASTLSGDISSEGGLCTPLLCCSCSVGVGTVGLVGLGGGGGGIVWVGFGGGGGGLDAGLMGGIRATLGEVGVVGPGLFTGGGAAFRMDFGWVIIGCWSFDSEDTETKHRFTLPCLHNSHNRLQSNKCDFYVRGTYWVQIL